MASRSNRSLNLKNVVEIVVEFVVPRFQIKSDHDSDSEQEADNGNFDTKNVPDLEPADLLDNNNHEINRRYYQNHQKYATLVLQKY